MSLVTRSINICKEMLRQRGYDIVLEDDTTCQDFIAKKPDNNIAQVILMIGSKVNMKSIIDLLSSMKTTNIFHAIIIYSDSVTSSTVKTIAKNNNFTIELFHLDELQFNITKHDLQPSFRKVTEQESIQLKRTFDAHQFPRLNHDDAISKFFHLSKGDIIEVDDDVLIRYRIVV